MADGIRTYRMLAKLAEYPGWCESLSPEKRREVMAQVLAGLEVAKTPREIAALSRALQGFLKLDLDMAGLEIQAAKTPEEGSDAGPEADDRYL